MSKDRASSGRKRHRDDDGEKDCDKNAETPVFADDDEEDLLRKSLEKALKKQEEKKGSYSPASLIASSNPTDENSTSGGGESRLVFTSVRGFYIDQQACKPEQVIPLLPVEEEKKDEVGNGGLTDEQVKETLKKANQLLLDWLKRRRDEDTRRETIARIEWDKLKHERKRMELKWKQIKSSITPSMSVEKMKEAQAFMKTPFLILNNQIPREDELVMKETSIRKSRFLVYPVRQ